VYQRDVTGGQTHFARIVTGTTTTSADVGYLRTAHTYEFLVTAVNSVGEGPASAAASVPVTIEPPAAPTGVTVTADTAGGLRLEWTAVPYAWR
jgi:hypothetical protein